MGDGTQRIPFSKRKTTLTSALPENEGNRFTALFFSISQALISAWRDRAIYVTPWRLIAVAPWPFPFAS